MIHKYTFHFNYVTLGSCNACDSDSIYEVESVTFKVIYGGLHPHLNAKRLAYDDENTIIVKISRQFK